MTAADNVIPSVRALGAYTLKATTARVKLNQNESPFDVPVAVKDRILARVRDLPWNRYPDFHPVDVLEGLGRLHGLGAANTLIGNGSNELIQAVLAATVGRGTRVALPVPTFTLYAMMVEANEGTVDPVPLRDDLSYDLDAWRRLADQGEAHLLLCSPNNPTGSVVSADVAADLARRTPRMVILDEAYAQFGPHDLSGLVASCPNVVVLRTFSKALGLAGIRFGYALAGEAIAREVHKVKLPYNVGLLGLETARELIADPGAFDGVASMLCDERQRLADALEALPFDRVVRGFANFVLVRTSRASALWTALHARGILVRDVGSYPMLAGCLRISVGTPAENDELIKACGGYFADRREGEP